MDLVKSNKPDVDKMTGVDDKLILSYIKMCI